MHPKSPYNGNNPRPLPNIAGIFERFDYDPELSAFFWKPHPRDRKGAPRTAAGRISEQGYVCLSFEGHSWFVHRLIWKLHTGRDPDGVIDHINGVRYDNRIENLRDVPQDINRRNRHDRLNTRLMRENAIIDRDRKLAERENKERALYAKLHAKYGEANRETELA